MFRQRDSSVGIATNYGMDGPGIETVGGEIFYSRPERPWGPPSLLHNGDRVFPGGKQRPGRGVDYPLPSSAEAKERVDLLYCSMYFLRCSTYCLFCDVPCIVCVYMYIEGKIQGGIEVTGRQGRRRRKLLDDLNTLRTGEAGLRF